MKGYRLLAFVSFFLILAGSIIGIFTPAGSGWDFANFYDTGRRLACGQLSDLYHPERAICGKQPQGVLAFYGAPLSAYLYVPLSFFEPETALVLFKIQNTLAYFIAFLILYFHLCRFVPKNSDEQQKFIALFLFLSLTFQPFWTIYRLGGQTTPTAFLLFSLALISHMSSRFWLSALLLILAVLIKPAFAIALLFLVAVSPLVFLRNAIVISLATGLFSIGMLGLEIHREFFEQLRRGLKEVHPWFYNSSLYVPFENVKALWKPDIFTGREWLLSALQFALKAVVVITVVKLIRQSRLWSWSGPAKLHFRFLMSVLFFLLMAQIVWEHYLSVAFLFLAYLVACRRHLQPATIRLVASIFFFTMGQNIIFVMFVRDHFAFNSLAELLLIGFLKSAPLYLTLILLLTRSNDILNTYTEWSKEANYG